MESTKYIHEGRLGLAFSYKTGAVVSSYPTPMLVLNFDTGGLDVVTKPVVHISAKEFYPLLKPDATVAPITAIDFDATAVKLMDSGFSPRSDSSQFLACMDVINNLTLAKALPWKTIVLDPLTGFTEAIIQHIQSTNSKAMLDARQWAYMAGAKILQAIAVLHGIKANTVVIMHSSADKNELTGEISYTPMIPSEFARDRIASLFSQYFYSTIENGAPCVYTQPVAFVKGVGARWPAKLPMKCGATYNEIYEAKHA
jgi:hypothetical protein